MHFIYFDYDGCLHFIVGIMGDDATFHLANDPQALDWVRVNAGVLHDRLEKIIKDEHCIIENSSLYKQLLLILEDISFDEDIIFRNFSMRNDWNGDVFNTEVYFDREDVGNLGLYLMLLPSIAAQFDCSFSRLLIADILKKLPEGSTYYSVQGATETDSIKLVMALGFIYYDCALYSDQDNYFMILDDKEIIINGLSNFFSEKWLPGFLDIIPRNAHVYINYFQYEQKCFYLANASQGRLASVVSSNEVQNILNYILTKLGDFFPSYSELRSSENIESRKINRVIDDLLYEHSRGGIAKNELARKLIEAVTFSYPESTFSYLSILKNNSWLDNALNIIEEANSPYIYFDPLAEVTIEQPKKTDQRGRHTIRSNCLMRLHEFGFERINELATISFDKLLTTTLVENLCLDGYENFDALQADPYMARIVHGWQAFCLVLFLEEGIHNAWEDFVLLARTYPNGEVCLPNYLQALEQYEDFSLNLNVFESEDFSLEKTIIYNEIKSEESQRFFGVNDRLNYLNSKPYLFGKKEEKIEYLCEPTILLS